MLIHGLRLQATPKTLKSTVRGRRTAPWLILSHFLAHAIVEAPLAAPIHGPPTVLILLIRIGSL